MAIIAGIDEAGLGPILGPLVVSGVAFEVPDETFDTCLWRTLGACVRKDGRQGGRKLVVADSKKLYKPGAGLLPLERPALVMLAQLGREFPSVTPLLRTVAADSLPLLEQYAWYEGLDVALPCDDRVGNVATRANAVGRVLRSAGVRFLGAFVEMLPAGHFNRLVSNTRNKSIVLTGLALRVAHRMLSAANGDRVRIHVDRLGGRVHYREPLQTAFAGLQMHILEESERRSAYRLGLDARAFHIDFSTKGDDAHFPVALASMFSKYLRELCMRAFNGFWCAQQEDLRPTAGYYNDAKRWLRDAHDCIQRLGTDRSLLIRQR